MVSMVLAWHFEKSPEGFIRTSSQKSWENPYSSTQKKPFTNNAIVLALMILLLVINAFTVVENKVSVPPKDPVERSIAVLPFYNLSYDSEQMYFADCIQEDILTQLSKNSQLDVRSRTSTLPYRNKEDKSMEAIGRELKVAHVLEGSVRCIDNKVRVTVQLIDVKTDSHIWSEVYDRELTNILDIQQEIAIAIAYVIACRLINEAV
jgi:TolB-like protein